jgi:hypothetical protein
VQDLPNRIISRPRRVRIFRRMMSSNFVDFLLRFVWIRISKRKSKYDLCIFVAVASSIMLQLRDHHVTLFSCQSSRSYFTVEWASRFNGLHGWMSYTIEWATRLNGLHGLRSWTSWMGYAAGRAGRATQLNELRSWMAGLRNCMGGWATQLDENRAQSRTVA